jgi:ABC-type nitrate/sulfonate/bicarbonate transport system permease component
MPTFTRTLDSWLDLTLAGELIPRLIESNVAMVIGYSIALVVGILFGLAMGLIPQLGAIARPYLLALIALPMIGILPLIQAVFGLGVASRVVVVFVVAFIYVTINAEVGAKSASPALKEMAHSFGASRFQALRHVVLPQAFPSIMAGTRLGLERAIGGMVLAELFLVGAGIGSLLRFHRDRLDAGAVFAIALTMVLEGVILLTLARRFERRVTRGYRA